MYEIRRFSKVYSKYESKIGFELPYEFFRLKRIESRYIKNSIYPTDILPKVIQPEEMEEINSKNSFKGSDDFHAIMKVKDHYGVENYLLWNGVTGKYKWASEVSGRFRSLKLALLPYLEYKMDSLMSKLDNLVLHKYENEGYEFTRIHNGVNERSIDSLVKELNIRLYSYLRYSYFIKDKL